MTAEQILQNYAERELSGREPLSHAFAGTFLNFLGNVRVPSQLESIAAMNLAAMLACPDFNPRREDGESYAEACARRACDFAEALLAEVARREQSNAEAAS